MAVCRSVRIYQRGSHRTDFRDIWCWELSWKICRWNPNLVKIVAVDIKSPQNRSLWLKWCPAVRPAVLTSSGSRSDTTVCMCQSDSHWTYFREIWYWGLLWKSFEKFQILVKIGKECRDTLHEDLSTFYCCRRHQISELRSHFNIDTNTTECQTSKCSVFWRIPPGG
jgi:DNA-directed RNA polymerase subunit N (RpoN/RPB10)